MISPISSANPLTSSHRMHHNLIVFILMVFITGFESAAAQDDPGTEKEGRIMVRVICSQPVDGATELKLSQGDAVLHDVTMIPSLVTDPMEIGRGVLSLARWSGSGDALVLDPIVNVTIPDAGSRFVLAMFPSPDANPKTPYLHLLIRTDGLRFDASDLYLHNLTGLPIAGELGKSKFVVAPAKSTVVTPVPEPASERMYQARFFYQREGEAHLFNDTRWPLAKTARVYLFFVPDPVRQSIGYVSFREYSPFP